MTKTYQQIVQELNDKNVQLRKVNIDKIIEKELVGGNCTAAYLNPVPDQNGDRWIYVNNETDPRKAANTFRDGMNSINFDALMKAMDMQEQGKFSESEWLDKINVGIFNIKDGWQDRANEYNQKVAAIAADGGGVEVPDYSGIEVSAMTGIIWGMEERTRVAQNALKRIAIAGTKYEYPELYGRITINRNITYGDNIPVKSGQFRHKTRDLKCDAAHFAMFDDVNYRPHSIDVWTANLQLIGAAFIRDHADQVVELLTDSSITNITGTNWTTATNNPYIDVAKAMRVLNDNNGVGQRIMAHGLIEAAFVGNPNTKFQPQGTSSRPGQYGAKSGGNSFFDGTDLYYDPAYPLNKLTIWDGDFVPEVDGPKGTAQYRDVPRFSNGWLSFVWRLMFIGDLTKIRTIDALATFT